MFRIPTLAVLLASLAATHGAQAFALQSDALRVRNDTTTSAYVRVPDNASLEPQAFTIEAWVRPAGVGNGQTTNAFGAAIVNKPMEGITGSHLTSWYLGWSPTTRQFNGAVAHTLQATGTFVQGQSVVPIGATAHVALTFDGAQLRLFVNGALDGEVAAASPNIAYGPQDVLFGASNFGAGFTRRFDGTLDEVRLWNFARSAERIAAEAACELAGGAAPGLVARWRFTNASLLDSVGSNHGTAVGAGVSFVPALVDSWAACGPIGASYCSPAVANSTGFPGALRTYGSALVAADSLVLVATELPAGSFGFFLTSRTQGFVANPGGSQGNLCLGGAIGRYVGPGQVRSTGTGDTFALRPRLGATPTPGGLVQVAAGETWNFQAWYRDAVGGSATSNFTDGVSVVYL